MDISYSTFSGMEYNYIYKDRYGFVIPENKELNKDKLKTRLNFSMVIDPRTGEGGINFVNAVHLAPWLTYKKKQYCRVVTLLNESKIFDYGTLCKTQHLALSRRMLVSELPYWKDKKYCKLMIEKDYRTIMYMQPTRELVALAIKKNADAVNHLDKKKMKKKKNKKKFWKFAVKTNGLALQYAPQTKELREIAVKQNGLALGYIAKKHQTPELCRTAIIQNDKAFMYIRIK